jgi:uncharacterized protein
MQRQAQIESFSHISLGIPKGLQYGKNLDMPMDLLLIVAGGALAGLVGALMGLGGGIVAVPFLNLLVGIPMHTAAAAGLISTLSVSCGAAGRYLRRGGLVNVSLAFRVELFAAAGGLCGGIAVGWLRGPLLQILFAITLIYGAVHILRTARRREHPVTPSSSISMVRRWLSYSLCFVAGIMSGLLGIGGGIVVVPVLHLVLTLPFKSATSTSNFMMGLTAVPALCGFVARQQLDLSVAAPLAAGVLLGANLGAWIMPRLRTPVLKYIFSAVLAVTAIEMARKGLLSW